NYTVTALDKHAAGAEADQAAVIWEGEDGATATYTYAELLDMTHRAANALRKLGVGKGDVVAIYLPMIPETVAATLACGKLGAIYVPIFSGYGVEAVATRLQDSSAKVLITADGYYRRGNVVPMKETADGAASQSPSVTHLLVIGRMGARGADIAWTAGRDIWWHETVDDASSEFDTVITDAEDPYMLIYTSGTTGKPK